jgi:hypothetical protein
MSSISYFLWIMKITILVTPHKDVRNRLLYNTYAVNSPTSFSIFKYVGYLLLSSTKILSYIVSTVLSESKFIISTHNSNFRFLTFIYIIPTTPHFLMSITYPYLTTVNVADKLISFNALNTIFHLAMHMGIWIWYNKSWGTTVPQSV